jgi:hypothetical protein
MPSMRLHRVILLDQRLRLFCMGTLVAPLAGSERNGFFFLRIHRDYLRVQASYERRNLILGLLAINLPNNCRIYQ